MKVSLYMNVYNEAICLPYMESILPYFDEIVIAEGSPIGLSIDDTANIIREYQKKYPIKFFQDTFRRESDGGYDSARMRNLLLDECTGDFVVYHHADMVYDAKSIEIFREVIDKNPTCDLIYHDYIQFYHDMKHLHLFDTSFEDSLKKLASGDTLAYNVNLGLKYVDRPRIGLNMTVKMPSEFTQLYVPQVTKYHLAFVMPYAYQVEKHVRRMTQREWDAYGETYLLDSFEAVFQRAIKEAEDYKEISLGTYPYCGYFPDELRDKNYCSFDGREEFYDNIDKYRERFSLYYDYDYYHSDKFEAWKGI